MTRTNPRVLEIGRVMLDGLPPGFPGRHSSGSRLGLLFAAVLAAACGFGLYRFLTYAAEYGKG